jgi:hypothetical protein
MRTIGVTVLGLVLGILFGFLLTGVVARIAIGSDGPADLSTPVAMVIGILTPALAVIGAVGAILVDRQVRAK